MQYVIENHVRICKIHLCILHASRGTRISWEEVWKWKGRCYWNSFSYRYSWHDNDDSLISPSCTVLSLTSFARTTLLGNLPFQTRFVLGLVMDMGMNPIGMASSYLLVVMASSVCENSYQRNFGGIFPKMPFLPFHAYVCEYSLVVFLMFSITSMFRIVNATVFLCSCMYLACVGSKSFACFLESMLILWHVCFPLLVHVHLC